MKAALIGAVEFNQQHFLAQEFDVVVAVDRGYDTCLQTGIVPDLAVGDFDSLGFVPSGGDVYVHPSVKDQSDMELALQAAFARGVGMAYVYGALASRLDHTIANLQVFAGFARRGMRLVGVGSDFAVVVLAGGTLLASEPAVLDELSAEREGGSASGEGMNPIAACRGNAPSGLADSLLFDAFDPAVLSGSYAPYLSVFALGGPAAGVVEEGLKYALAGQDIPGVNSLGLSNEFVGSPVRISVASGSLAVFMPLDALPFAIFS